MKLYEVEIIFKAYCLIGDKEIEHGEMAFAQFEYDITTEVDPEYTWSEVKILPRLKDASILVYHDGAEDITLADVFKESA